MVNTLKMNSVDGDLDVIDLAQEFKRKVKVDNHFTSSASLEKIIKQEVEENGSETFQNLSIASRCHEFVGNVGIQGVRYVFHSNVHWFRRLFWTVVVVVGSGYSNYVFYQNFIIYLSYPTTLKTSIITPNKVEFPAVTICNANLFQRSKLNDEEFDALGMLFPLDFSEYINRSNILQFKQNVTELAARTAYDYFKWGVIFNGHQSPIQTMSTKMRDLGVCVTFDPSVDYSTKYQVTEGYEGGFSTSMIVNDDEWAPGPSSIYSGFILLVHDILEEPILVKNFGVPLISGFSNEIVIEKHINKLMAPPYGNCGKRKLKYFVKYSYKACIFECRMPHVLKLCGCLPPHMAHIFNMSLECNLAEWAECAAHQTIPTNITASIFDPTKCDCPVDCEQNIYKTRMTLLRPSKAAFKAWETIAPNIEEEGFQIRVFYQHLQYEERQQISTYTIDVFLGTAGGAMGVMLGCSFATGVEILDFLVVMGYELLLKFGRKNRRVGVK